MMISDIIARLAPDAQVYLRDGVPKPSAAGLLDLLGMGLIVRRQVEGVEVLRVTDSGSCVRRELRAQGGST